MNSRNPAAGPAAGHRAVSSGGDTMLGTKRERAVLRLPPTRLSKPEIGRELYASVSTVRSCVTAIYRKLDATSRAEAVARARHLRLLPESTPTDR